MQTLLPDTVVVEAQEEAVAAVAEAQVADAQEEAVAAVAEAQVEAIATAEPTFECIHSECNKWSCDEWCACWDGTLTFSSILVCIISMTDSISFHFLFHFLAR
jgi:hypothetical protein